VKKAVLKKRRMVAGLRVFEVSARFWFPLRRTEKRGLGGLAKVEPLWQRQKGQSPIGQLRTDSTF
jgi:hypothetical protein